MSDTAVLVHDYFEPATFARIKAFADTKETPLLVVDTATIDRQYDDLVRYFPYAEHLLRDEGQSRAAGAHDAEGQRRELRHRVDLRTREDFRTRRDRRSDQLRQYHQEGERHPRFYQQGVRMFATDSEADLRNIAKAAPGSKVYVRILTEGTMTADWPLSRKFGCESDMAMDLMILARDLGLEPYGVSFHVGSQQREIGAWDAALGKVKVIFSRLLEEDGIQLKMINMGGGFPANYLYRTNDLATYAAEITRFLQEDFGNELPKIIIEPGRSLISNAGVLVSEVVLISRKSRTALHRWVYTDVGKFSGLIETLDESIKFRSTRKRTVNSNRRSSRDQPATAPTSCTRSRSTDCR